MSEYTPVTSTLGALIDLHGLPFTEDQVIAILKDERVITVVGECLALSGAGLGVGRNVECENGSTMVFYEQSFSKLIDRFLRKRIPAQPRKPTPKPEPVRHNEPSPNFDDFQSKGAFYSMGAVIKRKGSSRNSRGIFKDMVSRGMIEVLQRESEATPGTYKKYNVLTGEGLKYGKNNKGYANKGTSMVFYVSMFNELMGVLYGE